MLIRTRAPVRIDFAGGWSDVALFTEDSKGLVVNGAINRYAYATLGCERQIARDDSVELQRFWTKAYVSTPRISTPLSKRTMSVNLNMMGTLTW